MATLIDNFEKLRISNIRTLVVLYSGGLDGTYFLEWAVRHNFHPIALYVSVDEQEDISAVRQRANNLGVELVFHDGRDELVENFIASGIHANARYQGAFPVSSSYTRPLFAKAAVELAQSRGADAIAHTATFMQNSSTRFHFAFEAISTNLTVVAPFLGSQVSRDEKNRLVNTLNLQFSDNIYSIDENLWARVIECGPLENPENDIPGHGIFEWTADIDSTPSHAEMVEVTFDAGLPCAVDGRTASLREIIYELNIRAGRHGVGRSNGLEETVFGVKNHEIREAPAAEMLITAHQELERAALSDKELRFKTIVEREWCSSIVFGYWFSDYCDALLRFLQRMSSLASGSVRIKMRNGSFSVSSKHAHNGLYYMSFWDTFAEMMKNYSYPEGLQMRSLSAWRRQSSNN